MMKIIKTHHIHEVKKLLVLRDLNLLEDIVLVSEKTRESIAYLNNLGNLMFHINIMNKEY